MANRNPDDTDKMASQGLAIVLLNWQNEDQTISCVQKLREWKKIPCRLIVVDNGSTPLSRNILSNILEPEEIVCSKVNRGYSGGNNLGISRVGQTGAQYVLLLNSDANLHEADMKRLLETMRSNPGISILSPIMHETTDSGSRCYVGALDIAKHRSSRMLVEHGKIAKLDGYPLYATDFVSGTVLLARMDVFDKIGVFEENYFFSGEVADLCKRARNAGLEIRVDLEAQASHNLEVTPISRRRTLYYYYSLRNRFLFINTHCGKSRPWYFAKWTFICLAVVARSLMRLDISGIRVPLLALQHGWTGRFGNQNALFS